MNMSIGLKLQIQNLFLSTRSKIKNNFHIWGANLLLVMLANCLMMKASRGCLDFIVVLTTLKVKFLKRVERKDELNIFSFEDKNVFQYDF